MSGEKKILQEWDDFHKRLYDDVLFANDETDIERQKRRAKLEKDFEAWAAYYFHVYASATPADFHTKASRRVLKNAEWYEVRAWSRELAKSTRTMMEVMYLALTGKKRNVLMVSNSFDNATRLLAPFKVAFERNKRLTADYGTQQNIGSWEASEFTAVCGCSFRALGAGQSPRGTRNESVRPDVILVDDIDTDEDCRNSDTIDKKWRWIESALMPTRSINCPLLVIFCGNIIAEYCCITEAIKKADHTDIVNIRTNGISSWPSKNSEADIDRVLSKISWNAAQGEYFNNPITEGKVFKDIRYGKIPPLSSFPFLVCYGDPSPSNNEVRKNSYKAVWLVGRHAGVFYVIRGYLEQTTNATFVEWFYNIKDFVKDKTQVYNYIENNTMQDPFYQQVFRPLFFDFQKRTGHLLAITPDDRKKPDKFVRIEGTLEPLNRMGSLVFNEAERDSPHMQRLIDQFKAVSPTNKHLIDGPDTIEGAVHILNNKTGAADYTIKRSLNRNKFRY